MTMTVKSLAVEVAALRAELDATNRVIAGLLPKDTLWDGVVAAAKERGAEFAAFPKFAVSHAAETVSGLWAKLPRISVRR